MLGLNQSHDLLFTSCSPACVMRSFTDKFWNIQLRHSMSLAWIQPRLVNLVPAIACTGDYLLPNLVSKTRSETRRSCLPSWVREVGYTCQVNRKMSCAGRTTYKVFAMKKLMDTEDKNYDGTVFRSLKVRLFLTLMNWKMENNVAAFQFHSAGDAITRREMR